MALEILDRVPTKPGRVLITPEDGSAPFYAVMSRADEPEQEGTPINKELLDNMTKAANSLLDANSSDIFESDNIQNGTISEFVKLAQGIVKTNVSSKLNYYVTNPTRIMGLVLIAVVQSFETAYPTLKYRRTIQDIASKEFSAEILNAPDTNLLGILDSYFYKCLNYEGLMRCLPMTTVEEIGTPVYFSVMEMIYPRVSDSTQSYFINNAGGLGNTSVTLKAPYSGVYAVVKSGYTYSANYNSSALDAKSYRTKGTGIQYTATTPSNTNPHAGIVGFALPYTSIVQQAAFISGNGMNAFSNPTCCYGIGMTYTKLTKKQTLSYYIIRNFSGDPGFFRYQLAGVVYDKTTMTINLIKVTSDKETITVYTFTSTTQKDSVVNNTSNIYIDKGDNFILEITPGTANTSYPSFIHGLGFRLLSDTPPYSNIANYKGE